MFYYSSNLMRRYSPNTLSLLCHVVLAFRVMAYLLCTDITMIWWIYAVQMLHGINFGLQYAVCSVYFSQIGDLYSKRKEGIDVKSTMQSVKGVITLLAMLSGSIIWLPVYERISARMVYILGSVSLIPGIMILWRWRNVDKKLMNVRSQKIQLVHRSTLLRHDREDRQ